MRLMIVSVLSLGLGVLAVAGLLTVARELFCERSLDTEFTDAGAVADHPDAGAVYARHRVTTP
jgi:hypothetical protein